MGVLNGEEFIDPEDETTQGAIISPLLGNVYLHHVLDQWFEREVRPPGYESTRDSSAMPMNSSSVSRPCLRVF